MYRIVDLGTLGGESSEAAGINLLGDVVGSSLLANGKPHAFLYRAGRMIDLGTLIGGTESYATAIADNGVIVGYGGINLSRAAQRYGPHAHDVGYPAPSSFSAVNHSLGLRCSEGCEGSVPPTTNPSIS